MKISLGRLKKYKPKLSSILATSLFLAVLFEIFVLYKYGYTNLNSSANQQKERQPQILDVKSYMSMKAWIERNNSFILPVYQLSIEDRGRDNPLLEY